MLLPLELAGVCVITPRRFEDPRGYVSEVYVRGWRDTLHLSDVVQENESMSVNAGTVRGLHFQLAPYAQAKLVRCVSGAVFDVAIDLRSGSETFGRHVSRVLSASNGEQLYVPEGFAHGFCTLEPNSKVVYKVSAPYHPESEAGVLWNDPDLGIEWPIDPEVATLSHRDSKLPRLREFTHGL